MKAVFSTIKRRIYCLLNVKKALKKFGLKTWCTKNPFGYRVVHHMLFTIIYELNFLSKLLIL